MLSNFLYKLVRPLVVATVFITFASSTFAESDPAKFAIHGFGTLGAVNHNETGVRFRRDISQAGGANAGEISFAQDSMLGVQLTAYLNPQLETSIQVLSRQTTDNNFNPQVTWAYVKFKPMEDVAIRAGRLGVEAYPQGDSAEIGYANLMIRQPIIFLPRTMDGLDATVSQAAGDGTVRLKGLAGRANGTIIGSASVYDMGGSKLIGGIAEYTRRGWTARVALASLYTRNEAEELRSGSPFLTGLSLAPNGADVFNVVTMKDRKIQFGSMSLAYDVGKVQAIASYNLIESSGWSPQHLMYANMGYRIDKVTPYVSWSMQHTDRNLTKTGIPDGLSIQTDAFNQLALFTQAGSGLMLNQVDVALGARYDFAKNMALKFQVDRICYKDPNSIVDSRLSTESVENRSTKSLTLLSVALDFVF